MLLTLFFIINIQGRDPCWKSSGNIVEKLTDMIDYVSPVKIVVICADPTPRIYSDFFLNLLPPQNFIFINASYNKSLVYNAPKQEWISPPIHEKAPGLNSKMDTSQPQSNTENKNEMPFHGVVIGVDKPITKSSFDKKSLVDFVREVRTKNIPVLVQHADDLSIIDSTIIVKAPVILSGNSVYPVKKDTSRKELIQRATNLRNEKWLDMCGLFAKILLNFAVPIFILATFLGNPYFALVLLLWLLSLSWLKNQMDYFHPRIFLSSLIVTYPIVGIYAFTGWEISAKVLVGFIILAVYADINCRNWKNRIMESPFDEHTLFIRFKQNEQLAEKASKLTQTLRPYLSFLTANETINFRFYTDHGLAHILYTLKKEAEILGWYRPKGGKLSVFENYVLYCATIIHDIGLFPFKTDDQDSGTEEIRKQHPERISEFIANKKDALTFIPPEELRIITEVAKYHSKQYDINHLKVMKHPRFKKLRLDLLSAILRIADACDYERWRIPPKEISLLLYTNTSLSEEQKEKTLKEYKAHAHVEEVRVNLKEGKLEIISFLSKDNAAIVEKTKERLQAEIDSVKGVFEKYRINLKYVEVLN